ncbi:MAG: peptidylprolyl isomerase [Deltaproteobacteria bacterium]|nr:peptidylprolyl isomerase [Deltaproteobacteria bacterium]
MHVVLLGLVLAAAPERTLLDRVVAVVDDDVITASELDAAARALFSDPNDTSRNDQIRKDILDQLIADRLLEAQLREAKIEVSEDDVDRAIDDIARQNKLSRQELEEAVRSRGMSLSQYKHDLEKQLERLKLVDLKVRSKVVIADADIKAEYERKVGSEREELVELHHLFFRSADASDRATALERARAARARVLGGESFEVIAKEVSEGPTAAQGGALGEMSKGSLLPELLRTVQRMKAGQISDPIVTDNGVHVVRLDALKRKDAPRFEELRGQIYQALYQREVERQMREWIEELRAQASVKVRL